MGKMFGTDGVRGVANRDPMTPQTVMRLGFAAGLQMRSKCGAGKKPVCVIGRDTRISGEMLEGALTAGLTSAGVDVLRAGVVPTPAVAFLVRTLGATFGAVISASHNPFDDNGVKYFGGDGQKLPDAQEIAIEETFGSLTDGGLAHHQVELTGGKLGAARLLPEGVGLYCEAMKRTVGPGRPLAGIAIAIDCSNGAASVTSPRVLRELGAEVFAFHDAPDGTNINAGCGSLHFDAIRKAVLETKARVGIAHDGDADRVILCDEHGALVDGDFILGIVARHLKAKNELPKDALVGTVMTNLGLIVAMKRLGIVVHKTQVGDRYVKEMMEREGIVVGGEQSGHIIFSRHTTTGDGLLTALQVLKVMVEEKKALSELHSFVRRFPQLLVNVRVREKVDLEAIPGLKDVVDRVERELGDEGRVVLRYSGTEPLARVMVEGPTEDSVRSHAEAIARTIREQIGERT